MKENKVQRKSITNLYTRSNQLNEELTSMKSKITNCVSVLSQITLSYTKCDNFTADVVERKIRKICKRTLRIILQNHTSVMCTLSKSNFTCTSVSRG